MSWVVTTSSSIPTTSVTRTTRRVLDRHDPLRVRDRIREDVQQGRLPGAGAAGDEDVEPRLHRRAQDLGEGRRDRSELDEIVHAIRVGREAADGQDRPVEGEGWNDGV